MRIISSIDDKRKIRVNMKCVIIPKRTYRSKDPSDVHAAHIEKGLITNLLALFSFLLCKIRVVFVKALFLLEYMRVNDTHADGEEDNNHPCIDVQECKSKDAEIRIVPFGIVGCGGDPANPTSAIV